LKGKAVFQQRYGDGDITKAKELLNRAGYSEAKPLKVDLWYRSNISHNVLAAVIIKAIADERMGGFVNVNLQGVESATAYKNLDKGIYPIFMLDWTPDYLDSDSYLQPFMDCSKGSIAKGCEEGESAYQGSFYYSDRANQWIAQARKTTDPKQRQILYNNLQDLLAEDVPFIPLWSSKDYLFVQKNIEGASVLPTSQIPFSLMEKQAG
jgi:peptide/nickel transport system substrate-binding protein